MKKLLLIPIAALAIVAGAQQITPVAITTVSFPPVTWRGPDAAVIAAQLAAITNASGQAIIPDALKGRSASAFIRVNFDTNGVLKSISAQVKPR